MKYLAIFLIFYSVLAADLVNLGKIGPTKKIKEKDFLNEMKEKLKHYKISGIKSRILNSVAKLATVKSDLGGCVQTKTIKIKNIVTLQKDYYDFGGELLFEKGEQRVQTFTTPASICVVNGLDINQSIKDLNALLSIGQCNKVMVANADFRKLAKKYKNINFYPYNKVLTSAMHVTCLPSRSEAYKEDITIDSIAVGSLK